MHPHRPMRPASTPGATTLLAWTRLLRAADHANQHCAAALSAVGLPPPEWYDVLLALERKGAQRPRDLQSMLGTEQYTLSRLIERMTKAGLVTRTPCPDDARGHLLQLTIEGRAMRAGIWPIYAEAIETALGARVSEEDRAALAQLLAPLAEPVKS